MPLGGSVHPIAYHKVMGIQDRDHLRGRYPLNVNSGDSRMDANNQAFAKSLGILKTAAAYIVIVMLLGLSLSHMLQHQGSVGNCSMQSINLDANGDGSLTYRDVGGVTLSLFQIPVKIFSVNNALKPLVTFFELKKGSCSGWISVFFNGFSWLLILNILNLLLSSIYYGFRRLCKVVLFDIAKLSPFQKTSAKLFRILCAGFMILIGPRYLLFLVVGVSVISALASRDISTTKNSEAKTKSQPQTVSKDKNLERPKIRGNSNLNRDDFSGLKEIDVSEVEKKSQPQTVSKDKNLERPKARANSNLYRDNLSELKKIDVHIKSVLIGQYPNTEVLAKALTNGMNSDLHKTYAIYRWVTQNIEYDTDAYFSNNLRGIGSASAVLQNRKAVCDGYSELMMKLGQAAGLKIEKIIGYGKGASYIVGNAPASSNHAWNAVWIDENWYLLDSTWDAGSINRETRKFVKKEDDFNYFLTSPSIFIYNHYPDLRKWQLLETEWTRQEFFAKVDVNERAFRLGLNLENLSNAIVTVESTPHVLDFATSARLVGQLEVASGRVSGNWALTVFDPSGKSKLLISAPAKGSYDLKLFGKHESDSGSLVSLLGYKLIVNNVTVNTGGFPETYGRYASNKIVLKSPMNGVLPAHEIVQFKLGASEAKKVVLYQNGKPIHALSQEGEFFVGSVSMSEGDVTIFAEFNEAKKLDALLRYQVR